MVKGRGGRVGHFRSPPCSWFYKLNTWCLSHYIIFLWWRVKEVKLGTSVLLSAPGNHHWELAWSKLRNPSLLDQKWGIHHFHATSALRQLSLQELGIIVEGLITLYLFRNMLRDGLLTNCCCPPPCNQLPAAVSVLGCKKMKSWTYCRGKTRQLERNNSKTIVDPKPVATTVRGVPMKTWGAIEGGRTTFAGAAWRVPIPGTDHQSIYK